MSKEMSVKEIKWLNKPQNHDYPSALSYLSLIYNKKEVSSFLAQLRKATVVDFKAKDVFRASRLPLLDKSNYHVKCDMKRIKAGKPLSPILLVRDEKRGAVIIADGYHRMCAACMYDEDATVPCKII